MTIVSMIGVNPETGCRDFTGGWTENKQQRGIAGSARSRVRWSDA